MITKVRETTHMLEYKKDGGFIGLVYSVGVRKLARKTGLSATYISQVINCKAWITESSLRRLLDAANHARSQS